jgi:hypothetical protein
MAALMQVAAPRGLLGQIGQTVPAERMLTTSWNAPMLACAISRLAVVIVLMVILAMRVSEVRLVGPWKCPNAKSLALDWFTIFALLLPQRPAQTTVRATVVA